MKKRLILLLQLILIFVLTSCSGYITSGEQLIISTQELSSEGVNSVENTANDSDVTTNSAITAEFDVDDQDDTETSADMTTIILNGDSISIEGKGATVGGSVITITSQGMYSISGKLNDGQIRVNTQDKEDVILVLNGVDINCSTSSPIYILDAAKSIIVLAENSQNYLTDGETYILEDATSDEPNAAIFSKDDLTINGSGSLVVNGNYLNGILSKDDLKITGGDISVIAVNDGIRGRNSIAIQDGTITVVAGGDGLQSNNDEEASKGYIYIEGGSIIIEAGLDGIQAETSLLVTGGNISITSGGGSINGSSDVGWGVWEMSDVSGVTTDSSSAKGLKAGVDISITGGMIQVDSSDDSIHTNESITIDGGELLLSSGDDGMHSDSTLVINGGSITITQSYEGIESANLTINDGSIHITSSDDGLNTSGGNDGSSIDGRPGQNDFAMDGDYPLYINGGTIYVDAMGDGIDINGPIEMTSGIVIVNGPINDANGALDYMGSFNMNGGLLIAVGSAGMAEAPSETSAQNSIIHNFDSMLEAGTLIHLQSADGEEIFTFMPSKIYQSVVFSSPVLRSSMNYVLYTGGNSTGTSVNGYYSDGSYSPGTQIASFTISSTVTRSGITGGGFPGGPGGSGVRPQRP